MSKKKKPIPPKPQILTREDMANSQLGRILGMKQIDVTTTKKEI